MEFVRNAWYVAGWSSEFSNDLSTVKILDENIVMYRTSKGQVIAMEDRCPHRFLPLSMGKLIGDDIQCGYHGITYNCEGMCVRIPGQKKFKKHLMSQLILFMSRRYSWIWMGENFLAETYKIFDMPQFSQSGWQVNQGEAIHLNSNYLNVAENLVDPAHVSFVHPTTLGKFS
ncbi:MAG: hypothetical protein CM1200mP30_00600 [Pseudomonadota bacterium]|nr:MAG: hypothetical protein CM1200mP30_00600 [Pseudomonadota bacterium]